MTDGGAKQTEPVMGESGDAIPAATPPLPETPVELGSPGKVYSGVTDTLVRQILALAFFFEFLLTVVLSFLHLSTADWPQTKSWIQVLLPAETALLGSATGFYFGTRSRDG